MLIDNDTLGRIMMISGVIQEIQSDDDMPKEVAMQRLKESESNLNKIIFLQTVERIKTTTAKI